jgi:hypothetical protein
VTHHGVSQTLHFSEMCFWVSLKIRSFLDSGKPLRNLSILAGTGLELSRDYMCILRDSIQKVYPNLEDNTILLAVSLINLARSARFDVFSDISTILFQYIMDLIVSSRRKCPGCWR